MQKDSHIRKFGSRGKVGPTKKRASYGKLSTFEVFESFRTHNLHILVAGCDRVVKELEGCEVGEKFTRGGLIFQRTKAGYRTYVPHCRMTV